MSNELPFFFTYNISDYQHFCNLFFLTPCPITNLASCNLFIPIQLERSRMMLNLPAETFWLLVPWPFIWMTLAVVLYFKFKKDDELEDQEIEGEK